MSSDLNRFYARGHLWADLGTRKSHLPELHIYLFISRPFPETVVRARTRKILLMAAAPADADPHDKPTEALLLRAVEAGKLDEVKRMLDSEKNKVFVEGDPVNTAKSNEGHPPLMVAALCGQAAMCDLLVRKKALLDYVDARGDSPLHKAAINGDLPVCDALM